MPFIDVKMFPGKTEEEKKVFAEKLIKFCAAELEKPEAAFSVAVADVQPEDWNSEVADKVSDEAIYAGTMYRKGE